MNFPNIVKYKGRGSAILNRGLIDKEIEFSIKELENDLNIELSTLPNHSHKIVFGHDGITTVPYEILSIWYRKRIGKIVMFPNFLSTSLTKWKSHKTIYKITPIANSRGKDLSEAIGVNCESEILFKSKTKFKIISVSNEIELQEYCGNDIDYILHECFYLEDPEIEKRMIEEGEIPNNNIRSFLEDI